MNFQTLRLAFVCLLFCVIRHSSGYCEFECPESADFYCSNYGSYCRNYTCSVSCYKENLYRKFDRKYTPPENYRRFVNYVSITINGSDTTELQTEIFINYPGLQILKIFNKEIRALLPGAFTGLINVTELYLNNNHLNNIKSGVFNSMKKLKILDLSCNDINYIDDHAFFNLQKLQTITLEQNKIAVLSLTWFSWSRGLTHIDLSHNLITSIEAKTIYFPELQELYLENNLIKNVSSICIHLSEKIEYLDLSNNKIEDYEACLMLKNIRWFKLASTNLTNIDFLNGNFNYLQVLVVSNNSIEEIGHTLTHLKLLEILNLSANKISRLPIGCFSNLTNLQYLNLSHNQISELELGVFQDLNNVINLDFSHNNLESLHEQCFHVMKKLKYLKINDNKIVDINVQEFPSGLLQLQISLENNKWKCPTLSKIIKNSEKRFFTITVASERKRKNIYGIFCEDEDFEKNQIVRTGTTNNETIIKKQLIMPNLDKFEENFKKTSLYALTKKIADGSVVDLKKFDDNFKNTEFYNFLKKDLLNKNFSAILKHFDDTFAETLVYKSLQKEFLKGKLKELVQENVNKSVLDDRGGNDEETHLKNYLDDGFRNSTFYKYFERFSENNNNNNNNNHNNNGGVAEKLVQLEKNNLDYEKHMYKLQIFLVLLLTTLVLITIYEKYQKYRRNFKTNTNNDTSSAILMT